MNRRVKVLITLLIGFWTSSDILAQQNQAEGTQFEINMAWGFAQGDFENNLDRPMPGIVLSFGGRTPKLPLVLSTEIGWLSYGFDNYLDIRFPGIPNTATPVSVVDVATKNSILITHVVARIVPFRAVIAPYVEGLVGFKYISTKIDVESEVIIDDDDVFINYADDRIFLSSRHNSLTVSYGAGAGINLRIYEGRLGFHNSNSSIYVHAGVQYLLGSEAEYLTENSIQPAAGTINFERVVSDTDMLIPKFGFRVGI